MITSTNTGEVTKNLKRNNFNPHDFEAPAREVAAEWTDEEPLKGSESQRSSDLFDENTWQAHLAERDSCWDEATVGWKPGNDIIVDEPRNEFVEMVWKVAIDLAHEVIGKDLKYHGAYRKVRKYCKDKYGDDGIPYVVHAFEKCERTNDDENPEFDSLGYHLLEYVCLQLEAQRPEPEPIATEEIEITPSGKTCVICGGPLKGRQKKYCSPECDRQWRKLLTPEDAVTKECPVCGKVFSVMNPGVRTCSDLCAIELRGMTLQKNAADRRADRMKADIAKCVNGGWTEA